MIAAMQWTAGSLDLTPELPLLAGLPHSELASLLRRSVTRHVSPRELVDLTMAVNAINGWNRLAISFRPEVGSYQPRPKESAGAGSTT